MLFNKEILKQFQKDVYGKNVGSINLSAIAVNVMVNHIKQLKNYGRLFRGCK